MSNSYIPGVCNLGRAEIRRRQLIAIIGLLLSVTSGIILIVISASTSTRLIIFIPLLIFAVGYVQSRKKFCLAYGFLGTFNFGKVGHTSRVEDMNDRQRDRKLALKILFQAKLLAIVLTLIFIALPL